jgi:hypothetical protein
MANGHIPVNLVTYYFQHLIFNELKKNTGS